MTALLSKTSTFVRMAGAIVVIMLAVAPATAGFDPKTWRFRKSVKLVAAAAGYGEIALDAEVYDRADRSLDDVRVVTRAGEEIPYVIRRWPASETMGTVSTLMVNLSVQPRRLTRFELQTLRLGQPHNQVTITIADPEFLPRQVTVEGSDDRKTWFVLSRGEVYRFALGAEEHSIGYSQSVYQFVRVTIHDDDRTGLRVKDAALRFRQVVPAREDRWFAGSIEAVTDPQARTTTVIVDAGFARLPIAQLTVTITTPAAFARPAEVEVSADRTTWQTVASTTLVRTRQAGGDGSISIPFGEVRARFVRLTVRNGDNPPLGIVRALVHGIQRTVLFPTTLGGMYWLYFGGPADSPQYDLPEVLSREVTPLHPARGSTGLVETNPAYVPPLPPKRPWTEEHPLVLWTILGGVGIALALLIIGTARAARPRGQP